MNDIIMNLITSNVRKFIYGACMAWIAIIIEWGKAHNVPLTQTFLDNLLDIVIALAVMGVMAVWSLLYNKFTGKSTVVVPKDAVPGIVQLATDTDSSVKIIK